MFIEKQEPRNVVNMNEFENRLEAYRAAERKKELVNTCKNYLRTPFSKVTVYMSKDYEEVVSEASETEVTSEYESVVEFGIGEEENLKTEPQEEDCSRSINWKILLFQFTVWCCLFKVAIYVEFGAVFVILSGFYLIWTNTRTQPRKPHEISAYSVFNPNCEPIMGTFDAEKLEAEMRYGLMI